MKHAIKGGEWWVGDCLELMQDIPDGSVDMILTDPPYGTMKGIEKTNIYGPKGDPRHTWDEALDHDLMLSECNRVLRPNGALLLFCQQPYTSKLITEAHGNLPFSYCLTWLKDHFANCLSAKKAPVNYTEDVCVFFKKYARRDFDGQHPLREYARALMKDNNTNKKKINNELGHRKFEHFSYVDSTQFELCTEQTYNQFIEFYGVSEFKPYEELKQIDIKFRQELLEKINAEIPKVFNLAEGKKYKSNVLEYRKDYGGLHPTQKPVLLLEDLIKTYSNEGAFVLDFTAGSGSTAVAAENTGRKWLCIERDETYSKAAMERIANHTHQGKLQLETKTKDTGA